MVRTLIRGVMERYGYQVVEAESAAVALQIWQGLTAPVDLLLTDLIMPGMRGRDLAALLKVTRPDMVVLFMSGYTDCEIQRHGALEDGVALLRKPFTLDELARAVREALDRSSA